MFCVEEDYNVEDWKWLGCGRVSVDYKIRGETRNSQEGERDNTNHGLSYWNNDHPKLN